MNRSFVKLSYTLTECRVTTMSSLLDMFRLLPASCRGVTHKHREPAKAK